MERGLLLMISAKLARRLPDSKGFFFTAEDAAGAFVANLASDYHSDLKNRAQWVVDTFDLLDGAELDGTIRGLFKAWTVEFQPAQSLNRSGLQA